LCVSQTLQIKNNSEIYFEWKKATAPLYMNIYIFNWTNPEDIRNLTTKPIFEQLGPYRFQEIRDKSRIKFANNRTSVIYRKLNTYVFIAEGSNGTLDDIISLPNSIALSAGAKSKTLSSFVRFGMASTLNLYKTELNIVRKVREMLYDGYEEPLTKFEFIFGAEKSVYDKAGYLYKKNATDEASAEYEIYTGVNDMSNFGEIKTLNNLSEFPYHKDECKKLKGSPGEFFPPAATPDYQLNLFLPEMCRSLAYDYEKDVEFRGMKGHKYRLGERAVDNGSKYQENLCFDKVYDLPSGVIDSSFCNFGSPLYASYPHFYKADLSFTEAVVGLEPTKELHESFTTLEPITGVILESTIRLQTNILLRPYESVSLFRGTPTVMLPVFYTEYQYVLDEGILENLRVTLFVYNLSHYLGVVLVFLGIVLILARSMLNSCIYRKKSDCEKELKEMKPLMIKILKN
jgi:scavenger receptor class B, member 1